MDTPQMTMNTKPHQPSCEDVALAAFIIGCLCHEGYVTLTLQNSDSRQDYLNAIQLTAHLLSFMRPEPQGYHEPRALPFVW